MINSLSDENFIKNKFLFFSGNVYWLNRLQTIIKTSIVFLDFFHLCSFSSSKSSWLIFSHVSLMILIELPFKVEYHIRQVFLSFWFDLQLSNMFIWDGRLFFPVKNNHLIITSSFSLNNNRKKTRRRCCCLLSLPIEIFITLKWMLKIERITMPIPAWSDGTIRHALISPTGNYEVERYQEAKTREKSP